MFPTKAGAVAGTSSTLFWVTIIIIIFIFIIAGAVLIFILIRRMQFNKKIELYEERNGFLERIGKDRAKEIRYNIYGDSAYYLRKRRRYLPRGTIASGKNLFFYFVREDGEWVNFSMTNINARLREAGVKFIHPDMRAFKSGLGKLMKENFEKKSFLKEYLPIIMPFIFFIITAIALYFIIDRIVASMNDLNTMTVAAKEVMEKASQVLSALNNICSQSGIK